MKKSFLLVPAALVLGVPVLLLFLSTGSTIRVDPPISVIGTQTPVRVRVDNPHGIRRIRAAIEQNGTRYPVYESTQPATRIGFLGKKLPPQEVTFPAGKKQASAIRDGKARLIVEAQSNDFRGKTDTASYDVVVNTRPLTLSADGFQHYINQGGSELVVFTVSGYWTEAGVRVGKYTFRSFPLPGSSSGDTSSAQRFSIFGFPWDVPGDTVPVVYARNPAGSEVTARFWFKLFPKQFRSRDLPIDDPFLEKVVNQIEPGGTGDLISRFLKINGEMRRTNNKTLADLRLKSEPRVLWSGPFVQLGNSKVESLFADTRSYMYKGKKVDQQTHLGFDLSVTQHVPVVASNDGKVVYAAPLGIYGNCIVVDHGYGLQSIYGHLSEISVKEGEAVKKGAVLGKSGSTGLAGGDHLHYSMQLDGVQVNPVEWWDEHWIHDRILGKIPSKP
jgi:murein DD-endopeptidase MepM/ murein hydrolase activator NlpD